MKWKKIENKISDLLVGLFLLVIILFCLNYIARPIVCEEQGFVKPPRYQETLDLCTEICESSKGTVKDLQDTDGWNYNCLCNTEKGIQSHLINSKMSITK